MNKKFSTNIIFQYLLLLLNPFLSFIFSFYLLFFKNRKKSVFVIAISISLIFVYFPIMYDTSSNFYLQIASSYSSHFFDELKIYNIFILYIEEELNLEYMHVILLFATISIYIWFYIFSKYLKQVLDQKTLFFMIIVVFSSLIYRNIMDLNRFYLATSIILLLVYTIEIEKINNKYLKILIILFTSYISINIHISMALLLFLYFITYLPIKKNIYYILPFLALILNFISGILFEQFFMIQSFLGIQDTEVVDKIGRYTGSSFEWGANALNRIDYFQRIIEIPLLFIIYYLGINQLDKQKRNKHIKFTLLLASVVLFLLSYKALYERYIIVFFLFSIFLIYPLIIDNVRKNIIKVILCFYILRFLTINILMYGVIFTENYNNVLPNEEKKIEMLLKPLYYPTFLLFDITTNGYSNAYIKKESRRGDEYIYRLKERRK